MNWIPSFFRRPPDNDLSEEMRLHIEERAEQLQREGLSPEEAERQARIAFGNPTVIEERSREVWQWPTFESIQADVRFALRQLRRSPGFTAAAVLTLALAIGANAVVFGVLNALILRTLNVPHPQNLFTIERGGYKDQATSYPDYLDLRDRNRTFEALTAYILVPAGLDIGKNPSESLGYEVTGNYFDALGIQPYLGRFFHAADEHGPNSAPFLVLSYAYWHSHFQDDRGVVGRVVRVNKHPFTILGVAPPEFSGTLLFFFPDFWAPLVQQEQIQGFNVLNDRGQRDIFMLLGHLKPGVTQAQAIADLNSIGSYLEKTYPKDDAWMTYSLARPSLAGDLLGPGVQGFMTGMMVLAVLILLAACANLGSLFAARAADRSREVALRLALGATRRRILRTLFTEAVLISLAGGALGLSGSVELLNGLSVWQPVPRFPISAPVSPDATVYAVALMLALVSAILFGLVPARQVLRTDPYEIIKSGSTGAVGRRITVRDLLLVTQIAICAVLVTSSLVAVRGLVSSMHSNFGFDLRNATIVNTDLSMAGYSGEKVAEMQKRILDAMRTIPGVEAVGLTDWLPLISGATGESYVFTDQATDLNPSSAVASPFSFRISPEYFQAAGTAVLAGRTFSWHDDESAPRVAVVNPEFAVKLFGSTANALGHFFRLRDGTRIQVVGIVEGGKYKGVTDNSATAMFFPILQSPTLATNLVIRSSRDPRQIAGSVKNTLRDLDRGLPYYMGTWSQQLDDFALFPSHVATVSLGVLGAMGAMLSITGIFGMAAYSVSRRKKELGIRIAIGAQPKEVLQAALGRAFKLLALGSAAGLLFGILAARVLASIVYQASPRDPLVLAGVVLAMLLLGLLATWIPARRALAIDPAILMRED